MFSPHAVRLLLGRSCCSATVRLETGRWRSIMGDHEPACFCSEIASKCLFHDCDCNYDCDCDYGCDSYGGRFVVEENPFDSVRVSNAGLEAAAAGGLYRSGGI